MRRPERRFWILLARTVFHCSVREVQGRIDSREFAEWFAEYLIEPWGDEWKQTASINATMINVNCKRKVKVENCMPGMVTKQGQSVEEMQARIMQASKLAVMAKRKANVPKRQ